MKKISETKRTIEKYTTIYNVRLNRIWKQISDSQLCELTCPAGGEIHYETSQFHSDMALRTTKNDQKCKVKKVGWLKHFDGVAKWVICRSYQSHIYRYPIMRPIMFGHIQWFARKNMPYSLK